jgi:HK97 family phage major capsid protein
MKTSLILRKVRGISGLTPLMRTGSGSFGAAPAPSSVNRALMSPLVLGIVLFAFLIAWLFSGAADAYAFSLADSVIGAAGITMSPKLREANEKLTAKSNALNEIFEKAGETLDFSKPEVLSAAGVKDSAAVVAKVKELNKELTDLGIERDSLQEVENIREQLEKSRNKGVNTLPHPSNDNGGDRQTRKVKTFGEILMASEAIKQARGQKRGSFSSIDESAPELKTLFQTSAGWAPESTRTGLVVDAVTRPIQVMDIVPSGKTGMAAVVYMEETTRTHAAAERNEGAAYGEATFALTQRSETVRSIGDSVPVTDEQLEDEQQAQSYLEQRLIFGCRQRVDRQIMIGDGVAPNLTGVVNKAGIQTQAKGADPTPDAVYKAMTKVRVTGRAIANAFVVHPNDWQEVRLLRTADGLYIWGNPSEAGPERIWGIQVVQCDALTEGTGVVGDFANFSQLVERKGLEVAVGYVNTQFTEGERTIRAGVRVAFCIYRAAAFATVTGI